MRRNSKLGGLLAILFAGFFLTITSGRLYRDWQFDQSPLRSTATIERTWTTTGRKGGTQYHAAYRYVINGVSYDATDESVMSSTYLRLEDTQQVPVRYLPQDFTQSRIDWDAERNGQDRHDEVGVGFCFLLAVFGLLSVVYGKRTDS
jgi:hypothetical protein